MLQADEGMRETTEGTDRRLGWSPAAKFLSQVNKRVLTQGLGEDIGHLLFCGNFLNAQCAVGNVVSEMVITDSDVLGSWTVLGLLGGNFKGSDVVFENNGFELFVDNQHICGVLPRVMLENHQFIK